MNFSTIKDRLRRLKFAREWNCLHRNGITALFIHGHMRSGSTVLLHVLCSNPDVYGIGETHASYRTPVDVARLYRQIESALNHSLGPTTLAIVDKILHDNIVFEPRTLAQNTRHIFIAREPVGAIHSMCHPAFETINGQDQAEAYYSKRLSRITALREEVRRLGHANLSLTHAGLTQASEHTLAEITSWLGLRRPLQPDYELLPTTGAPGYGDSSATIRGGKLLAHAPASPVTLPRPIGDAAHRAYDYYRRG